MHTVIIVGTGFGGISAAIALKNKGIVDFIMLERHDYVGGTWKQNTYPGAAVDVPSPLYSISGEPYPWKHLYAKQDQLSEYTTYVIDKHQLRQHIKTDAEVKEAVWKCDYWLVRLQNGQEIKSRILINSTGPLSSPVIPKIQGLDKFKGEYFHSNQWSKNISLAGKNVAIIGSGASAVQIIPELIKTVKKLHVFQRTPHWVLSRFDFAIPKFLQKTLYFYPIHTLIRWLIYWVFEIRVIAFKYSDTALKFFGSWPASKHIKRQINDAALQQKITPDFTIGCKRILVSDTYYPALQAANCVLHDKQDGIKNITEQGIHCELSDEVKVDVIVFATGFDAEKSMVSYKVQGEHGQELSAFWQDYPRAYLGTSLPKFPNFFIVTGPNTGIGHTSAIFVIESQMKYIMQCIEQLTKLGARSIQPTEIAEDNYTKMIHTEMAKTVWYKGGCNSWYQNKDGKVIAMFPGFSFTFRRLCKNFKPRHHRIGR